MGERHTCGPSRSAVWKAHDVVVVVVVVKGGKIFKSHCGRTNRNRRRRSGHHTCPGDLSPLGACSWLTGIDLLILEDLWKFWISLLETGCIIFRLLEHVHLLSIATSIRLPWNRLCHQSNGHFVLN